jgi:hypothetical protein
MLFAAALSPAARAGVLPDGAFSDKAAGTTGAAFLKLPAGARAEALGSSYVAAVDNSDAVFWNPAGLARMEEADDGSDSRKAGLAEAGFGYNALLESSYAGHLSYAQPLGAGRGVLGLAAVYFSQSAITRYDVFGNASGQFTPIDLALSAAYGKSFGRIKAGAGMKYIRSSIDDASGSAFALDVGVQALRVTDLGEGALDVGLSLRNFGPPIKLGSVSDPLPMKLQFGGLWHISPVVNGLLDIHIPVDQDPYLSLGGEGNFSIGESIVGSIRGGYNISRDRGIDGLTAMSAGFGLDVSRFRLDYAWVPFGELGTTHRISMGFRF